MSPLDPRRIILLRHGRTGHNAAGRIQGQLDIGLDDTGLAQAEAAAQVLAKLDASALVTSDLARARGTAQAVADVTGLPLRTDQRLRELHLGAWQGLTIAEAAAQFPDEYDAWRAGRDVARGGGETYREAGERAVACLTESLRAVPAGGTLLAVTHGGTARAAIGHLLGLGDAAWRLGALGNTCWSGLTDYERGWRLEQHNVAAEYL